MIFFRDTNRVKYGGVYSAKPSPGTMTQIFSKAAMYVYSYWPSLSASFSNNSQARDGSTLELGTIPSKY